MSTPGARPAVQRRRGGQGLVCHTGSPFVTELAHTDCPAGHKVQEAPVAVFIRKATPFRQRGFEQDLRRREAIPPAACRFPVPLFVNGCEQATTPGTSAEALEDGHRSGSLVIPQGLDP